MASISKQKLVAVLIVLVLLAIPTIQVARALYTVPLATNTIYADDMEGYPTNQKIGCSNTQGFPDGWGWVDCAAGGVSNITGSVYFSCCHSLATTSPTAANGVFDVDKKFGLPNANTRLIAASVWFTFTESYMNEINNNAHISLEGYTQCCRYEAPVFFLSHQPGQASSCKDGAIIDPIGSTIFPNIGGVDHVLTNSTGQAYCLVSYSNSDNSRGTWHHLYMVVNVQTYQWVQLIVDGLDLSSARTVPDNGPIAGSFLSNHGGGGDNEFNSQLPSPWRFEMGAANPATHTVPADTWVAFHDNLIITDVTPGVPNIIQFGIVASSALFPLIMIAVATLYGTSGVGLLLRTFKLTKGPAWLANPKVVLVTGAVATVGFLFMLIIAANLVAPACPNGYTCRG